MITGSRPSFRGRSALLISPFLTDVASGGGIVSRMNLACLRSVVPQVTALALSATVAGRDGSTVAVGRPSNKLVTALCNLLMMAGRLTPIALFRIARYLFAKRPDLVFLDSSSLGWVALLVRLLAPRAKVVVFFHNVEFDFQVERSRVEGRLYLLTAAAEFLNEWVSTRLAHSCLLLTREDALRVTQLYRREVKNLAPVCLSDNCTDNLPLNPPEDVVLFVGSGFYANREAVEFLLKQLAPLLRDTDGPRIRIAGSGFSVDEWPGDVPSNVEMLGRVPDLKATYTQALAFVAPVFSGAGMKVKVAEALMHGLPVVGTPLALRGYIDRDLDTPHLMTATTADDFARAIAVCRDAAKRLSLAARRDFETRYSLSTGERRMRSILERVLENSD